MTDGQLGEPRPSDFDDPNDYFIRRLIQAIERRIEYGTEEGEAATEAVAALFEALDEVAESHAERLRMDNREYVSDSAAYRTGFAQRLREHWGEALDLYEVIVSICEQGGTMFARRNLGNSSDRDLLLEVLVQVNGQAVRVAREVHALLSAGFPIGALASARTIHELSVIAGVLAECGVQDEHKDLAERFVAHDQVINFEDAKVYQRDAEKLRYTRFTDADMSAMEAARDAAIDMYGKDVGRSYGWAIGLPGLATRPSFVQLERLAGLEHHRGLYKWASHFVHGDSRALRLGRISRGGSSAVLTNATNTMLADPGQHALHALTRVFTSMVTAATPYAFYDHLVCGSLRVLLSQADDLFVGGEKSVDEAEERLQAELAAQGLAIDLVEDEVPLDR